MKTVTMPILIKLWEVSNIGHEFNSTFIVLSFNIAS